MKQTPEEAGNGGSDMDSIMAQEEVETDLFCLDNRLQRGRRNGDRSRLGSRTTRKEAANSAAPSKQSKKTVDVQSFDNSATKTVAEQIRERGEVHVDNESKIKTPVE
eukprot:8468617-Ditylum_brightwellii.AAC.1